jgi:ferredoxin
MKIKVDQDRCASSGQCVLTAPDVFDQREEDGVVTLLQDDPPAESADAVRRAVVLCPTQAIDIEE